MNKTVFCTGIVMILVGIIMLFMTTTVPVPGGHGIAIWIASIGTAVCSWAGLGSALGPVGTAVGVIGGIGVGIATVLATRPPVNMVTVAMFPAWLCISIIIVGGVLITGKFIYCSIIKLFKTLFKKF